MTKLARPWLFSFFLLLAGGALAGCAQPKVTLRPQPRAFTEDDYEKIYKRWTRGANEFAFGRLSDVLHATATFESWEFRWAYVVRYCHDHHMNTLERRRMLRETLDDAKRFHRFYVTMAGQKFPESDITNRRSAWRVVLVDQSGEYTVPIEVERIRKPGAADRMYFPSVSPFRHAFRIAFPVLRPDGRPTIPPGARLVWLRFAGAAGVVDLRWEFI